MGSRIYTGYHQDIRQRQPSASFQYAAAPVCSLNSRHMLVYGRRKSMRSWPGRKAASYSAASGTLAYDRVKGRLHGREFRSGELQLGRRAKERRRVCCDSPWRDGTGFGRCYIRRRQGSLKFYVDAESSGKAQLNPGYGDQDRIIPADQLDDAKAAVNARARRNELKGRTDVAEEQRAIADKLTDRIRGENGVESTPLTKQQDLDMAAVVHKDADGNVVVDEAKLDQVMDDTGISGRVRATKLRNELTGLGMGVTMSLVSGLARVGLDSEQIGDVVFDSLVAGTESGDHCGGHICSGTRSDASHRDGGAGYPVRVWIHGEFCGDWDSLHIHRLRLPVHEVEDQRGQCRRSAGTHGQDSLVFDDDACGILGCPGNLGRPGRHHRVDRSRAGHPDCRHGQDRACPEA